MIILDFATGRRLSAEESRLAYRRACEKKGRRGTESRKSLLAKVHIAKKQLALEDELYRALLRDAFSASSAAELSEKELQDLLMRFQSMGFQPAPGKRKRSAPKGLSGADSRARYLKKLEALLAEKGRAEGQAVPWDYAAAILKRQTGGRVTCVDKAGAEDLRKVIAALVYDARRKDRCAGTRGA